MNQNCGSVLNLCLLNFLTDLALLPESRLLVGGPENMSRCMNNCMLPSTNGLLVRTGKSSYSAKISISCHWILRRGNHSISIHHASIGSIYLQSH
ncbi:hypothetical protein MKW98_027361 [Papaver atlanticum]|uniref:Uncharacterized protein n=1 Tax=Papaver atlanticum TaxID=357466 RepID=A0AAD4XQC2_9MAGN|nr:hypothetical protein MKW98_027361 [Papaver atlanticum]